MTTDRQNLINDLRSELRRLPQDRMLSFPNQRHAIIRCPYHAGGMERDPAMKVNLDFGGSVPLGWCWCWVCKQSMPWDTLAELFGLTRYSGATFAQAARNDLYLQHFDADVRAPDHTLYARWPVSVPWRDVPGTTLREYDARSIKFGSQPFLYMPAMVYGESVGGINCRIIRDRDNKAEKPYLNTSGEWSARAVFGFDQARRRMQQPLWVVEGPRDTAWVDACGCRASGLIGAAITPDKLNLIRELNPPSIISGLDPDEAGEKAHRQLLRGLEQEFPIEPYPFAVGQDPCDLAPHQIQQATLLMIERYGGSV